MLNKKTKTLTITTLLIMILSLQVVGANSLPLKDKIITIDAGHPEYSYTQDNEK